MKKIFLFISVFLVCFVSRSQEIPPKPCKVSSGSNEWRSLDANPDIFARDVSDDSNNESFVIPVVVHVFGRVFNNEKTVTRELVEEALRKTNEDFQGLSGDYTTIDGPFDVIKKPLDITFKLAHINPEGSFTSGVLFYDEKSGSVGLGHDDAPPIVSEVAWDNYKYFNVFITRDLYGEGDFYDSGVAWYPSVSDSDKKLSRVVYNGSYLGSNTDEEFRSTLTHEFGHWLNLMHTFSGGCNSNPTMGDRVADTPPHVTPSSGTQCRKVYNCFDDEVNNENFMDYSNCYKMFTVGQIERMVDALHNSPARNTLWTDENLETTGVNLVLDRYILPSRYSFKERLENDGMIGNSVTMTCNGCTFRKNMGDFEEGTDYQLRNLPDGLSLKITAVNNKEATIYLEDYSMDHEAENSTNLTLIFNPQITSSGQELYNGGMYEFDINFMDVYTNYCTPKRRFTSVSYISEVEFNQIGVFSDDQHAVDYTKQFRFPVIKGETYPLKVTTNKGLQPAIGREEKLRIQCWFDWNDNFLYESDELLFSHIYDNTLTDANGDYTYIDDVTIPAVLSLDHINFRVTVHFVQGNEGDNACSVIDSGESEDYGLSILDGDSPLEITISANQMISLYEPVRFIDVSSYNPNNPIVSREWTFEGGSISSSTKVSPIVNFPNPGTYKVSLTVTTMDGTTIRRDYPNYITSIINYCMPSTRFAGYFNISNVRIGDVVDEDIELNNYYNSYNQTNFILEQGKTYPMTFTVLRQTGGNASESDENRVRVWGDWNGNSRFDSEELIVSRVVRYSDYDADGNFTFTEDIKIPLDARTDRKLGLRIMGHFVQGNEGDNACSIIDSGNITDFGVNLSEGNESVQVIADVDYDRGVRLVSEAVFKDRSSSRGTIANWDWTFLGGNPSSYTGSSPPPISYDISGEKFFSLTVTDDEGNEDTYNGAFEVKIIYCMPSPQFAGYFNISNVRIGDVVDEDIELNDYSNSYNQTNFILEQGKTYPMTFTVLRQTGANASESDENRVRVWGDWNGNSRFDSEELIVSRVVRYSDYDADGNFTFTEDIKIPLDARTDRKLGLRIMGHYVDGVGGNTACGSIDSGNIMDFGVNLSEGNESVQVIADVDYDREVSLVSEAVFKDRSSSTGTIAKWDWTFLGGNPSSYMGSSPPPISYDIPGEKNFSLTVTDDEGNEDTYNGAFEVIIIYCMPSTRFGGYFNISNVRIGDVLDEDIELNDYYNSYNQTNFILEQGKTYPMTFTVLRQTGANAGESDENRVRVWGDWNGNSRFDSEELIVSRVVRYSDYDAEGNFTFTEDIKIPLDARTDRKLGLRIMGHYVDGVGGNTACGSIDSGNITDFGVNVDLNLIMVVITTNTTPKVATPLEDVEIVSGATFGTVDISATFSDPEDDALIYTVASSDTDVVTVTITNTTLTLTEVGTGMTTIIVNASDGDFSVADTFAVSITNTAPTVANELTDVVITAGAGFDAINLGLFFPDSNGDELMYVATSNDTMVVKTTITDSTLTLTEVAAGMTTIIVNASDGDFSVADTFAVSITNTAPTVANELTDVVITAGAGFDAINLGLFFPDSNGDELMYVATSNDTMVVKTTITDSTLTLTEVAAGMTIIIVTASDGDFSVADTFAVSINEMSVSNRVPVRTEVPLVIPPTVEVGFQLPTPIDLSPFFTDPDGDDLMFTVASSDIAVATVSIVETSKFTFTAVAAGTATLTVTVADPDGLSVKDSVMITVTEKAKEPLGIAETDILAVYPNPSTGIFQLSRTADVVRVYDMSGRLVYRGRKVEQLDLTNNVAGQYLVEVRVGRESGRYTVIKE